MDIKIKNKYFFKNKKQMITYLIIFVVFIILFIILGTRNYDDALSDNLKFHEDFPGVIKDNIYEYINARDLNVLLNENTSAVFLFGSSQNKWTEASANILNEVAMDNDIEQIFYYDFFDDRVVNNGNYEQIVEKLSSHLYVNDYGKQELNAPLIVVMLDGKVIFTDDSTAFVRGNIDPDVYWNEYNTNELKNKLDVVFKSYNGVN